MTNTNCIAALLVCLSFHVAYGSKFDSVLKKQLEGIYADDQRYRPVMALQPGKTKDSLAKVLNIRADEVNDHYGQLQNKLDSINLAKVEAIFLRVGYPGKTLVGAPANEAAFSVIQHTWKIRKYFPLIEKAGLKGELSFVPVAMMQDRLLKEEGKEQIYGSQYAGSLITDPVTHEQKINWFLWPVKDYAHVNERRKKAGFKDTVAENAADQGITLTIISLADAKKKYPWLFPQKK